MLADLSFLIRILRLYTETADQPTLIQDLVFSEAKQGID
jgi:hypothetical protein